MEQKKFIKEFPKKRLATAGTERTFKKLRESDITARRRQH